jgi:hypothetical protein
MLLDIATLIALVLGFLLVRCGQRQTLDAHPEQGLSFLQLGKPASVRAFAKAQSSGLCFAK